jgi:hypothetical protein
MLVGAGAAGAAAVALATVPQAAKTPVAVASPDAVPEQGGGYRLSPHVMRYYQTAKV